MKKIIIKLIVLLILVACQCEKTISTEELLNDSELTTYHNHLDETPIKLAYLEVNKGQVEIDDEELIQDVLTTLLSMEIGNKVEKSSNASEREYNFIYGNGEVLVFIISRIDNEYTIYSSKDGYEYEIVNDNGLLTLELINEGISFAEATKILINYDEIRDNLELGMDFMDNGSALMDGQEVRLVNMGINKEEQFVVEKQYAVFKNGEVKSYDILNDEWISFSTNG